MCNDVNLVIKVKDMLFEKEFVLEKPPKYRPSEVSQTSIRKKETWEQQRSYWMFSMYW